MRADGDRPSLARWNAARRKALAWHPPKVRTVFVVPHPDDEALSMGGLIVRQSALEQEVLLVAVTDGDAAYDADGDPQLATERRLEQDAAVDALGLDAQATRRLGIPDGKVGQHEPELVARLSELVDHDTLLIAPWARDVHPDHEAVGRAAITCSNTTGARLMASMFWAWHLRSPSALPTGSLRSLALTADEQLAKWHAIGCHRSQIEPWHGEPPILDDGLLVPTRWPSEYFVEHHPTPNA